MSVPVFKEVDVQMLNFLHETDIPGAACAIVRDGKLLYARGFGYSNVSSQTEFQPDTLCRIASVSKPITAVAVLQLCESGKLVLDEPALKYTKLTPFVRPGSVVDQRLKQVTIRDLLQHRSGIDLDYWPITAKYSEMGLPSPLSRDQIVSYYMGSAFSHDPGRSNKYNNANYSWLAHIIESVSGETYEEFVKKNIWSKIGASGPYSIKQRHYSVDGEATYYDLPNRKEPSVFPKDNGKLLPKSYGGGIDYSAVSGAGSWVCSVIDLGKFVCALQAKRGRLLGDQWLREIARRPQFAAETDDPFYGLGFSISNEGRPNGQFRFSHEGGMSGACASLQNRFDGSTFIVIANGDDDGGSLAGRIIQPLHDAINPIAVANAWPDHNLFDR